MRLLAVKVTGTFSVTSAVEALSVSNRSALAITLVLVVAVLLAVTGSCELLATVAEALIAVPAITEGATFSSRFTLRDEPGAMLPANEHWIGEPAQDPPPETEPEEKLVPAGTAIVRLTPVATEGPSFLTTAA